jgi:hypothetical protein
MSSFLKKSMREEYTAPWEEIRDKAGVRVITVYESQVSEIDALIRECFKVHHSEDKRRALAPDQLDYLGVHFEVSLLTEISEPPRVCEIQVHTRAQNLWATVSHDLLYKPPQEPPTDIKRPIYRLIALLELFDGEIQRARQELLNSPGYEVAQMLDTLEQQFYRFSAREGDPGLSRQIIASLQPLFGGQSPASYAVTLAAFVDVNREKLQEIFAEYADDDRVLLLSQPECLVIFQQLTVDQFTLTDLWTRNLPPELLKSLADVWGVAVDV